MTTSLPTVNTDPVTFPQPLNINGRNYWRLGDLRRFDAAQAERAGLPASPPEGDDETLLSTVQVRRRYGNVSNMTLWRWLNRATKAAA